MPSFSSRAGRLPVWLVAPLSLLISKCFPLAYSPVFHISSAGVNLAELSLFSTWKESDLSFDWLIALRSVSFLSPLVRLYISHENYLFGFGNSCSVFIDCHTVLLHVFPALLASSLIILWVHMQRQWGLRSKSYFPLAFFSPNSSVQCCISIAGKFFPPLVFSSLLFGGSLFLVSCLCCSSPAVPVLGVKISCLRDSHPHDCKFVTLLVYCQWDHLFRLSYLLPLYWYPVLT